MINGYHIEDEVGAGGFGVVYRARQSSTFDREVAIKVIQPRYANEPDFIRRFESEAQLIARLEHAHIVPLYDYWRDPDGAYLVMRWMRGGSLKNILKQQPLDVETVGKVVTQICASLAVAHQQGVIHRDIKPSNILLDEYGNAYLADFGIAKDLMVFSSTTQPDAIIGSPGYLSPEQARSEAVSPRTDVYSLGVTVYELLAGKHPFDEVNDIEKLYKHLNEPLPYLSGLDPNVEGQINEVIQKATAKNPIERYATSIEFASAFHEAAKLGQPSTENIVTSLSIREQEILQGIIDGKSNKEIANQFFISVNTVRWYLRQIYKKLNVRSRVQAVVKARELNLIVASDAADTDDSQSLMTYVVVSEPENPYKGLKAFTAADTMDFFGREKLTKKLLSRLQEDHESKRFLAVIGPSGSGKSSLVKAGLIPAIWRGDIQGSDDWYVVEMLPGSHPLDELEIALTRVAADQGQNLMEHLQRDERGLVRVGQLILPDDDSELLIVIDQFEEIFTLVEDEARRDHFLKLISTAITDPRSRVRVVVTLRADFYDRPLQYPHFGEMLRNRMETILPLSAEELENAIVQPAKRVGVKFADGLVSMIVSDVNYQPGSLPLLQYALMELFEGREGRIITREAYQQIGGTVGALARRANHLYEELDDTGQALIRQMMLRLVTLGEGTEDTRRRTARAELLALSDDVDLIDDIIDTFATYRLLALDHDPTTREPTVEVAHEAILREWEQLRLWLNDSRDDIKTQRQVAALATAWNTNNHDESYLVRGRRLEQFQLWSLSTKLSMTPTEMDFLSASLAAHETREAEAAAQVAREKHLESRAYNRLKLVVAILLVASAFGITLTIGIFLQRQAALKSRDDARSAQVDAEREKQNAEDQRELTFARELAFASVTALELDPELSVLLALQSLNTTYSREAENALHRALPELHILRTMTGHRDQIWGLIVSPDEIHAASAAWDGTIRIWNMETGQEELVISDPEQRFWVIEYSRDGTRLYTGSWNGLMQIWDTETGAELDRIQAHQPESNGSWTVGLVDLAVSPDGSIIASGGSDLMIYLWDAVTGEKIGSLIGHEGHIWNLSFSVDGSLLISADTRAAVNVWDWENEEVVSRFISPSAGGVSSVAIRADNEQFAVGTEAADTFLVNVLTHEIEATLPTNSVWDIQYNRDGTRLLTAGADGKIRVWDSGSGIQQLVLAGHVSAVFEVQYNADESRIISTSGDRTVKIWDIGIGYELQTISLANTVAFQSAFTSDGTHLIVAAMFTDYDSLGNPDYFASIASYDVLADQITELISDPRLSIIFDAAYSQDELQFAIGDFAGFVTVWDMETQTKLFDRQVHNGPSYAIAFSPDGQHIASVGADGFARVYDIATGELTVEFNGHGNNQMWGIAYSPDGQWLASSGYDNFTHIWDANTGEILLSLPSDSNNYGVDFSPDQHLIATSYQDGSARIWDADTGESIWRLCCHTGLIMNVEFSPDGTRLASTSQDGKAKIWDVATGEELFTLYGRLGPSLAVAFNPVHETVATSGYGDGTTRLYTLDLDELVSIAQSRVTRSLTDEECHRYLHVDQCPDDIFRPPTD